MEITITIKLDENEVKISETKKNNENSEVSLSQYARFFDDSSPEWDEKPEYNLMFLRAQQVHMNNLLVTRGYVFLNEVYEALGMEKTKAGQLVGWVYDKDNPIGDNYIDFGLYNLTSPKVKHTESHSKAILLDFNVDGVILDKVL